MKYKLNNNDMKMSLLENLSLIIEYDDIKLNLRY